jgi:putative DNA primase/helicase
MTLASIHDAATRRFQGVDVPEISIQQFRIAIQNAGLHPPEIIEADGELHRFPSNGKRGDDAGWYVLHLDGIPAGAFGDWRSGLGQKWRVDVGHTILPEEEAAHWARVDAMRRQRETEEDQHTAEAREKAGFIWHAAKNAPTDHPYLLRKGIKPYGVRLHNDALVIPMRDEAMLHGLQFIGADGDKRFLTGSRVSGCYFLMGEPRATL